MEAPSRGRIGDEQCRQIERDISETRWIANLQSHHKRTTLEAKMTSRKNSIGWLLLLMLIGSSELRGAGYAPRVGEPHPDFVLPRIDNGEAVRLSQFRGQRVLLVHFASW